jgi:hypothetical protein
VDNDLDLDGFGACEGTLVTFLSLKYIVCLTLHLKQPYLLSKALVEANQISLNKKNL